MSPQSFIPVPKAGIVAMSVVIANIHRPGALTPSIVLSLGLGIALLVTVIEIDGNLRLQFNHELPAKAPSFYFLDIPTAQAPQFTSFLHKEASSAKLEDVPMLRGRITAINGIPIRDAEIAPTSQWLVRSDIGFTFAATFGLDLDKTPKGVTLYDGPTKLTD